MQYAFDFIRNVEASNSPAHTPARGPPLWDDCDAPVGVGGDVQPDWAMAAQAAPDYEVEQHKLVNYKPSVQNRLGVGLRLWRAA